MQRWRSDRRLVRPHRRHRLPSRVGRWHLRMASLVRPMSIDPDDHLEAAYDGRFDAADDGRYDDDPNPYEGTWSQE